MADGEESISIKREQLARLGQAVLLASTGSFEEADALLREHAEDDFGATERVVRELIGDYRASIQQSLLSVEEFRASKHELQQKLDTIGQQQAAIRQLSAPLIDVWERIIAVPLIGAFDRARAQDLSERLLTRIQQAGTSWVLLDLTGLDAVDAGIAEHILRLASAVRLMGATCILTGMRASVAKLLTSLGSPIDTVRSLPTLREGLKHCMAHKAEKH